MKRHIINLVLFIALIGLLPMAFAFAQESNLNQTLELIRQRINEIGQRILELQTKLEIIKKASDKEASIHINEIPKFTKTLYQGIAGDEVKKLQEFLKTPPAGGPDIYPEGLVTGYFGPLTEKAVRRFQEKNNIINSGDPISAGYGLVGPKTRDKLNELTGLLIAPIIQKEVATSSAQIAIATSMIATSTSPTAVTLASSIATSTSPTATVTQPIISEIPIYSGEGGGGGGGSGSISTTPVTPAILPESELELEPESELGLELEPWLEPEPDVTPPVISDIQVKNIAETSAVISWTTDELANSKVNYAESSSVTDSNYTINPSLNLTNFTANTTYHYVVVSVDISGNTATSSENSFTTLLPSLSASWLEKVKITNSAGEIYYPAVAWTGINGGIVWSDYSKDEESEIFFALFDSNGQKIINNTKISASPILISYNPDIVWNGDKFAAVWAERSPYQSINLLDGCGIYLTIIDMNGIKQINDVTVAWDNYGVCPDQPVITADQTGFDVYWRDAKSETESGIYHKKYNFEGIETEGETKFIIY